MDHIQSTTINNSKRGFLAPSGRGGARPLMMIAKLKIMPDVKNNCIFYQHSIDLTLIMLYNICRNRNRQEASNHGYLDLGMG